MSLSIRRRINFNGLVIVEMCSLVEQYLEGHISRNTLDRRFGRFVRTIAKSNDQQCRHFYGFVRNVLAERGYGHRTEDSVRKALRKLLDEQDATPSTLEDIAAAATVEKHADDQWLQPFAKALHFDDNSMVIDLEHGGSLVVPLAWFPLLTELSREALEQYEVTAGGTALHWESVDEWISVPALIGQPC